MTRRVLYIVLALSVILSCSDSGDFELLPVQQVEFDRRLRLATEQILRNLPAAATAELGECERMSPGHPELLFQQARLMLFENSNEAAANEAVELLRTALVKQPDSVKINRLLYEIEMSRGHHEQAHFHDQEVTRIYGEVGTLEMNCLKHILRGDPLLIFREEELRPTGDSELDPLLASLEQLRRVGGYAPGDAVPKIEKFFKQYDELAALRAFYVRSIVGGTVRLDTSQNSELGPLSSELVLEAAQIHNEKAFDQVNPRGRVAQKLLRGLSWNAAAMGEYADAVVLSQVLLSWPGLPTADRPGLYGRIAISHFKLGRFQECVNVLQESISEQPQAMSLEHHWVLREARSRLELADEVLDQTFRLRDDLTKATTNISFEDVAPQLGIDRLDGYGPNAWGDYDRDGDFDLFVSGGDSYCSLFRNDGNGFVEVSEEAGIGRTDSGFSSTFVDYDNDGWPDIYVGRNGWVGPAPNSLFRNRGDGTFEDVTEAAGLGSAADTFVHTWSDVDRDGDLDLFLVNGVTLTGEINRLYRNNNDGSFTDITIAAGLEEPSGTQSIGAAFGDYDKDGWPDLFVSGCFNFNRLYHNLGDGTFEEIATEAGVDGIGHYSAGYVCFFADFNNDGWLDILRTANSMWKPVLLALENGFDSLPHKAKLQNRSHSPRLYINKHDGTFREATAESGLIHPTGTMGAMVGDIDNDGWLDIYLGTGSPMLARLEPDRFYRANGDGSFSDLTFVTGLGNRGKGHGVTMIDIDGDGDLEIYAAEGGMVHGDLWNNAFYMNHQSSGNHWFHIDLQGVTSNRDAVGTKILLITDGRIQFRELQNGEGFGSTNSPTIEFGLGSANTIDRLELRWPSGVVQEFQDLAADQRIFVREGEEWVSDPERTP